MLYLNGFQLWCHFKWDMHGVYRPILLSILFALCRINSLADAMALGKKNGRPEIQLLSR